jgi:hypothetical protein
MGTSDLWMGTLVAPCALKSVISVVFYSKVQWHLHCLCNFIPETLVKAIKAAMANPVKSLRQE